MNELNQAGDTASLVWSVMFGAIGVGFCIYGRRQRQLVPWISGVALMVVPYFVDGTTAMVSLCVGFMALPYFVRL
jgi:hypothetical protein